jgi:hypothetical protein
MDFVGSTLDTQLLTHELSFYLQTNLYIVALYRALPHSILVQSYKNFECRIYTPVKHSCFNEVGHLLDGKQSKRGWEPQIFYSYFVMSQLYEIKIP